MSNDRAYIHEFIDIRGAHRANYMPVSYTHLTLPTMIRV